MNVYDVPTANLLLNAKGTKSETFLHVAEINLANMPFGKPLIETLLRKQGSSICCATQLLFFHSWWMHMGCFHVKDLEICSPSFSEFSRLGNICYLPVVLHIQHLHKSIWMVLWEPQGWWKIKSELYTLDWCCLGSGCDGKMAARHLPRHCSSFSWFWACAVTWQSALLRGIYEKNLGLWSSGWGQQCLWTSSWCGKRCLVWASSCLMRIFGSWDLQITFSMQASTVSGFEIRHCDVRTHVNWKHGSFLNAGMWGLAHSAVQSGNIRWKIRPKLHKFFG